MPRVKSGVAHHARKKKIMKAAKGGFQARSKLYKAAKENVERGLAYAYRDRRKKKSEFRIHVFKRNGEYVVIDRQQKTLRTTHPTTGEPIDKTKVNFMIRNHRNGFIFQRNDIKVPADVEVQALKAMKVTGLDFGAVDVIWNEHEGRAYVLEINTAPGLEGTTLDNYIAEFRNLGIGSEAKTA